MICKTLEKIAGIIAMETKALAIGVVQLVGAAGRGGQEMDVTVLLVGKTCMNVY